LNIGLELNEDKCEIVTGDDIVAANVRVVLPNDTGPLPHQKKKIGGPVHFWPQSLRNWEGTSPPEVAPMVASTYSCPWTWTIDFIYSGSRNVCYKKHWAGRHRI
jgi:hypothetical protein